MAKSGQVQLFDDLSPGDEPLADSVVYTESTPTSLGGIVADLLDKSTDALKVVIDTTNRKVVAFPVATDVSTKLGGTPLLVGTITRDDPTKRSSPVTRAAGDDISGSANLVALAAAMDAMFGAAKPSKNVASLVNAAEDAIAAIAPDLTISPGTLMVVVDQTGAGSVKIYGAVDSLTVTGATAKIKQVPTAAGSTVTPLAFE